MGERERGRERGWWYNSSQSPPVSSVTEREFTETHRESECNGASRDLPHMHIQTGLSENAHFLILDEWKPVRRELLVQLARSRRSLIFFFNFFVSFWSWEHIYPVTEDRRSKTEKSEPSPTVPGLFISLHSCEQRMWGATDWMLNGRSHLSQQLHGTMRKTSRPEIGRASGRERV